VYFPIAFSVILLFSIINVLLIVDCGCTCINEIVIEVCMRRIFVLSLFLVV